MSRSSLPATDPRLSMVGWRYQIIKPCPAISTRHRPGGGASPPHCRRGDARVQK